MQRLCQLICARKPDSIYFINKPIRIFLYKRHCLFAIVIFNTLCHCKGKPVPDKKRMKAVSVIWRK